MGAYANQVSLLAPHPLLEWDNHMIICVKAIWSYWLRGDRVVKYKSPFQPYNCLVFILSCGVTVFFIIIIPTDSDSTWGTAQSSPKAPAVWHIFAHVLLLRVLGPLINSTAVAGGLVEFWKVLIMLLCSASMTTKASLLISHIKKSLWCFALGAAVHTTTWSVIMDFLWAIAK